MTHRITLAILLLWLIAAGGKAPVLFRVDAAQQSISCRRIQAGSGAHYLCIFQGNSIIHWTIIRPKKEDESIVLCIPAAFTGPYGGVDGFYVRGGQPFNKDKPNKDIGGAVVVLDGRCQVLSAPSGKIDGKLFDSLQAKKGDFFQQFQLVVNGKGEKFKDRSRCQRRGIAIRKDNTAMIVESIEPITLSQFGADIANMGVQQMAYTDMGPWDEGWCRNPASGKVIALGQDRSLTDRQTNWLYFRIAEPRSLNAGTPKEPGPQTADQ